MLHEGHTKKIISRFLAKKLKKQSKLAQFCGIYFSLKTKNMYCTIFIPLTTLDAYSNIIII